MANEQCPVTKEVCLLCISRPLQMILRVVLAAVFIYAAIPKLMHPDQFAENLLDYQLLPVQSVNLVAVWLPAFELIVALALLLGLWLRAASLAVAGMSVAFLAGLVWVVSGPTPLPCSCFSTDPGGAVRTWGSLWQEAVLVLLSLPLWVSHWPHTDEPLVHMRRRQVVGLATAALVVVLLLAGIVVGRTQASRQAVTPEQQEAVSTQPLPKLLDLGAEGCHACQQMAPDLEALTRELQGKANVQFVDVGKDPSYAEKYDVVATPTQIVFDAAGKQLGRHEGVMTKDEALAWLRKLGLDVPR